MTAMGVGLTLTAASRVIFVELPWCSTEMEQCEDRCHRIGQRDNVLIDILCLEDSIDSYIAKTITRKESLIGKVVDGRGTGG
jgi:SWI/SNF-related matrix-associated actin-dependent regulator 1 of chromatin subfamily A